jgi:hypothetical protein
MGRGKAWFGKSWGRYVQVGPEGLYDLTRTNHHVAQALPPELERLSCRSGVAASARGHG